MRRCLYITNLRYNGPATTRATSPPFPTGRCRSSNASPVVEEIAVVCVMLRRAYSGRGHSPERMKLEDEDGNHERQVFKRAKWDSGSSSNAPDLTLSDHLDEPSPLGLHLRKSPSLLDLIQMRLSQESSGSTAESSLISMKKKDVKSSGGAATAEKMKASNFLASLLRIGSWECVSRHDGDLIAKFYYSKHKLVWEVLDCGLKSKIEIQWADIRAIRASFPDNGPGAMDIVLVRQPLFFKETNPQPRKHTLWQATSDFTNGQASIHRRHILQCPRGLLNKHFEKLAQCDPQFNMLIQEKDIILESPFFETKSPIFEDLNDVKSHDFNCLKVDRISKFPAFHGAGSPCTSQSTSCTVNIHNVVHGKPEAAHSTTTLSSVDCQGIGESGGNEREELKSPIAIPQVNPGLHSSLSVSDLVNHLGNCISNQMAAGSHFSSPKGRSACSKDMLEEITQHLLSDSQFISSSDEKSLMSRVNSLCCLQICLLIMTRTMCSGLLLMRREPLKLFRVLKLNLMVMDWDVNRCLLECQERTPSQIYCYICPGLHLSLNYCTMLPKKMITWRADDRLQVFWT